MGDKSIISSQTEIINNLYNSIQTSSEVFFRMSKKPIDKLNEVQRACVMVLAALKTLRVFEILSVAIPKPDEIRKTLINQIIQTLIHCTHLALQKVKASEN